MNGRLERWLRHFQRHLERFYDLERAPNVYEFLQEGGGGAREQLLVREGPDGLFIALVIPPNQPPEGLLTLSDEWAQLIEGVSHFLFLAERARRELSTTQLELELQAEIDKFILLSHLTSNLMTGATVEWVRALLDLHQRLYEEVRFLHDEQTDEGVRYRLANRWAARYVFRLMQQGNPGQWRERLRAFYHAGPAEKISLLNAA